MKPERTALLNNIDEVAQRISAADAHHLAMKSASDSAHERMREADEHAKNAQAVSLLVARPPFKNIALRGQMKAYIRDLIALGTVGHVAEISAQAN